MLDNIEPHVFDNQYCPHARPEKNDVVLYIDNKGVYVRTDHGELAITHACDFPDSANTRHLFSVDNRFWFLSDRPPVCSRYPQSVGQLRMARDVRHEDLMPMTVASHLAGWYACSRFCGACGAPAEHSLTERAMCCPQCGIVRYPTVSPAVIVAITRGDTLLLARGTHYTGQYFSLIAGYVEAGERLERAACREVMEETGLHIRNLSYYGSQPWPFSGALMVGFFAEAEPNDSLHLQADEIAEAAFYHADEFPEVAGGYSIAGSMIDAFKRGERPHGGKWAE